MGPATLDKLITSVGRGRWVLPGPGIMVPGTQVPYQVSWYRGTRYTGIWCVVLSLLWYDPVMIRVYTPALLISWWPAFGSDDDRCRREEDQRERRKSQTSLLSFSRMSWRPYWYESVAKSLDLMWSGIIFLPHVLTPLLVVASNKNWLAFLIYRSVAKSSG